MMPGPETIRPVKQYVSPFARHEKPARGKLETAFIHYFDVCVMTLDDDEEAAAYAQLKQLYLSSRVSDRGPSFFEALEWARRRSRAELPC